ncbi:efflux RND transporter periplasmic adaptor subunit [Ascidiimonas sp. W6]|uniref:efflux RND transporter periplasmic adaptor subunit n=1 Tax=Ascidiimonas meishanensis TaxID=3128903 RepID=UPI0030EBEA9E
MKTIKEESIMDRKIVKKKWYKTGKGKMMLASIGVLLIAVVVFYQVSFGNRMKIEKDKLTIATVVKGDFQEYILETGEVIPNRTYFLDAVEGGNIVQVFKESGTIVKKGEPILQLENANLRLSVLSQENSLNEQINRVRTTRLQLDQNYLSQKKELAEIENSLQVLAPKFRRDSILYSKDIIAKQEIEQTKADFLFNQKRKKFTNESFKNDSTSRIVQLRQLRTSEIRMIQSLDGVRQILDNLIIKAPIDGLLSTEQFGEGENIEKGQRIGQVDVIGSYKVRVSIDELYLSRIKKNLRATATLDNKKYLLTISYIYPTVKDGEFDIDLKFDSNDIPEDILSGQSIRLKIELGNPSKELLVPVGGFYNDTGGNWVFILNEYGNKAVKRDIVLGKKNVENYQILEGLSEGDQVIISSYDEFMDSDELRW